MENEGCDENKMTQRYGITLKSRTNRVEVGGFTKEQLAKKLQEQGICINDYGKQLLADERFSVSKTPYRIEISERTVADLGFPEGATLLEIYQRAEELGLSLCPLELGPYLRMQYRDQPIAEDSAPNQAPAGSLTIASEPVSEDDGFPKGFYLRNIAGQLWLRGYTVDEKHLWSAADHFIFTIKNS